MRIALLSFALVGLLCLAVAAPESKLAEKKVAKKETKLVDVKPPAGKIDIETESPKEDLNRKKKNALCCGQVS